MNSSTPSTTCTYSLAAEPGCASDHSAAAATSTPNTTSVHSAAVLVATTIGVSAVSTPITRAAQSCHRCHDLGVIAITFPHGDASVLRLTGRPVKKSSQDLHSSSGTPPRIVATEYARSGFWQLLAVTVPALGVIVVGARFAPAGAGRRGLLSALAGLTLVIVASALSRMWLYQEAYGFTVLRLLVLVCELWLGLGFVLVLGSVLLRRPRRPLRAMAVSGALALLALAALDPERFVAEQNAARFEATGRIDTAYLADLSADAVPAPARLPEPQRACALEPIAARAQGGGWREANVARAVARDVLTGVTPSSRGCGY